jgi:putative tricarboxylic transport membrane protein
MTMMGKRNLASGLFFFAFGLFLGIKSQRLSVWSRFGPDEGFFPLAVAVIIMGLSLIVMVKAFISLREQQQNQRIAEQAKARTSGLKVSSYVVLMLLYGALLEKIGFLITSALFLFLIIKFVEKQNWVRTISVGVASMIVSYVLFVYFLGVPLPRGWIKGW